MKSRSLLRVIFGAGLLTLGPGVLSASCSTKDGMGSANDAGGQDGTGDGALCPPPSDAASRCNGSSPSFTFYPALACAPSDAGTDAGAPLDAASDGGDAGSGGNPCADVTTNATFFTPAACTAFAAAESGGQVSVSGGTRTPAWTAPNDGDVLTADQWSIFAWTKGTTAQGGPLERAIDVLEPSAHAFTPLRGDAYVLEFTVGCTEILRVMLDVTAWTPDPAAWAILTSQTKPVTVRVVWMKFVDDAIAPGTTAVASAPITFSMKH